MTKQISRLVPAVNKLGVAVRGLYGEGTESVGDIYQISNQLTLGHSEKEIIQHLATVARQVIDQERGAREQLLKLGQAQLEDRCYRAYEYYPRLAYFQPGGYAVGLLVWLGGFGADQGVDARMPKSPGS